MALGLRLIRVFLICYTISFTFHQQLGLISWAFLCGASLAVVQIIDSILIAVISWPANRPWYEAWHHCKHTTLHSLGTMLINRFQKELNSIDEIRATWDKLVVQIKQEELARFISSEIKPHVATVAEGQQSLDSLQEAVAKARQFKPLFEELVKMSPKAGSTFQRLIRQREYDQAIELHRHLLELFQLIEDCLQHGIALNPDQLSDPGYCDFLRNLVSSAIELQQQINFVEQQRQREAEQQRQREAELTALAVHISEVPDNPGQHAKFKKLVENARAQIDGNDRNWRKATYPLRKALKEAGAAL